MKKFMRWFYVAFFLLIAPYYAFAYLDPGTGSLLLYAVIGIASSIIFALRNLWYRMIEFFFSKKSGGTTEKKALPDIVFHSEGGKYWQVFKPMIQELLKRNIECAYITPDKTDEGLLFAKENTLYRPINPGKEMMTISYLNNIKTKLVISTTPGLDVYMWKRSKHVEKYIHVFHAPTGIDLYEKYGLSFYDCIFSVGDFQEAAQNKLDDYRGLSHKKFYPTGCLYYDYMVEELKSVNQDEAGDGNTILYAPSWGARSSVVKYGTKIIEKLLETNMNVIFRPHPQSFVSDKQIIEDIKKHFTGNASFSFDTNRTGITSMIKSELLVTDLSGVLFDYAYLFNKPILIVNYETKLGGYEAEELGDEAWDVKASLELAEKAGDDIENLPNQIMSIKQNNEQISEKILKFKQENIYNFACAGKAAADNIVKILEELKNEHN